MATTSNQVTADSSNSSSSSPITWDVFLSFYGKDTRCNFTSHLYSALDRAGILTFRDDPELQKGQEISSGLLDAIKNSKMFVVVLSENYARSPWCLNELVEILSCKRTKNQVVPVFYYVDPSDLRYNKRNFGEAFESHKRRYSSDMLDKWKSGLAEIAGLSGYHLKKDANKNESDTIQEIVENVAHQTSTEVLHLEEYQIGRDAVVEEIYLKLSMESNDVRAIGICGMGGIGKTTTAKAFYNKYSHKFDISCFIETQKQQLEGDSPLLTLLNQLLTQLLRQKNYVVWNVERGIRQLQLILCSRKALIVLDDLHQSIYSEVHVRLHSLFSAGSRIVITTRDANLLNQLKVDIPEVDIYMLKELGTSDSLELFCYHAFRKPTSPESFKELTESFVTYAGGVPLALKVLGSSLRGRTNVSYWKGKLEKVQKIPDKEIQKILQLSYDELDDETDKAIFLYIAFFFVGKDKDEAVHIFNSCEFFPDTGIPNLVERCLLEVDRDNKFQMHNLIQDMGREIGRSRGLFWRGAPEDMQNLEEPYKIEGLILDLTMSTGRQIAAKIFKKLSSLRLLEIIGAYDTEGNFKNLFHELRCIRWRGCQRTYLSSSFCPRKLVSLDMSCSKLKTLWKSPTPMKQLTNLGHLNMRGCSSMKLLPEQLGDMKCLRMIDASYTPIKELPDSIACLKELAKLNLNSCKNLKKLPKEFGTMEGLRTFDASNSAITRLPDSFVGLINLVELQLGGCKKLRELPEQFGNMEGLKVLELSWTAIEQLPDSTAHLKGLVELNLCGCRKLRELPDQFGNLEGLKVLVLDLCAIEELPNSITRLKELVELNVNSCYKLRELPTEFGNMEGLRKFKASYSEIQQLPDSFVGLINLVELKLNSCKKLRKLPEKFGTLKGLRKFDASFSAIEHLPDSFGQLINLVELKLYNCEKLRMLPEQIGNMESLMKFDASFSAIEQLPDSFERLINLVELKLYSCKKLRKLPEEIGNMESLRKFDASHSEIEQLPDSFGRLINLVVLDLNFCKNLTCLPNSIWKLKLLEVLNVNYCSKLKRLPEHLGKMQCLEELNTCGTEIEELPDSIGLLSKLQVLAVNSNLKYVPDSICNLTLLTELRLVEDIFKIDLPIMVEKMKLKESITRPNIRLWQPVTEKFSSIKNLHIDLNGHGVSATKLLTSTKPISLSKHYNHQDLALLNWTSIGSSFPELPVDLTYCHLSNNTALERIPDFSNLKQLETLNIVRCISLQSLPALPPHLKKLQVRECTSLQHVPDLSMLKKLRTLSISKCGNLKLINLKESFLHPIKQLPKLSYLNLDYCGNMKRLPERLGDMKGLKMINASYTAIEKLPGSISHLKKLVELRLSGCMKLRKLPRQIGYIEGLMTFDASDSAIKQLPDSFGRLIYLVNLNLSYCRHLTSLPNSILMLKFLKVLDVDHCSKLECLPEQFGEMHCLEELYASFTEIEELPESIKLLSKLQVLVIKSYDRLKSVPSSIWNLTSLIRLCLLQVAAFRIDLPDTLNNMKLEVLCLRCNIRLWMPVMLDLSSLQNLYIVDDGQCVSLYTASNPSKIHNLPSIELPLELTHMVLYDKILEISNLSSSEQKELYREMHINLESLPPLPPNLRSDKVLECSSLLNLPDLSMSNKSRGFRFIECINLKLRCLTDRSPKVGRYYSSLEVDLLKRDVAEWLDGF